MLNSRRLLVVFLGPDGSGKTTISSALEKIFHKEAIRAYLGEKEFQFGFVKRALDARSNADMPAAIKVCLTTVYNYVLLPIDLLSRRIKLSFALPRPGIVLVDRVPGFPFVSGSRLLRILYQAILSRPDIVVFLHGDAQVLADRKGEVSAQQIAKDILKLTRAAEYLKPRTILKIDTTLTSPASTIDRIRAEIVDKFEGRSLAQGAAERER